MSELQQPGGISMEQSTHSAVNNELFMKSCVLCPGVKSNRAIMQDRGTGNHYSRWEDISSAILGYFPFSQFKIFNQNRSMQGVWLCVWCGIKQFHYARQAQARQGWMRRPNMVVLFTGGAARISKTVSSNHNCSPVLVENNISVTRFYSPSDSKACSGLVGTPL